MKENKNKRKHALNGNESISSTTQDKTEIYIVPDISLKNTKPVISSSRCLGNEHAEGQLLTKNNFI